MYGVGKMKRKWITSNRFLQDEWASGLSHNDRTHTRTYTYTPGFRKIREQRPKSITACSLRCGRDKS